MCRKYRVTSAQTSRGIIYDLGFGKSYDFSWSDTIDEVRQYVPRGYAIKSVSSTVTSVKILPFKTGDLFLVGRTFTANYGHNESIAPVQKFSLFAMERDADPLFISGPDGASQTTKLFTKGAVGVTNTASLFVKPHYSDTNTAPLTMVSSTTGVMPLHLRTTDAGSKTLYIGAIFKPTSDDLKLSVSGPIPHGPDGRHIAYEHGSVGYSSTSKLWIRGSVDHELSKGNPLFIMQGVRFGKRDKATPPTPLFLESSPYSDRDFANSYAPSIVCKGRDRGPR